MYNAIIDPVSKTFKVTQIDRTAQYQYPLTQLYPNVLQVVDFGWTPNFWADIKLVHPLPGSAIDAFDARVIAILPAKPGVRFIYPVLGVGGNNSVVLEPDGYTKSFDSLGGSTPGNVNPFKAYFKDQPYRVWSGTGVTEETQRWQMNLAGFGGPTQFKLVVEVSTNYPNPPQSQIDNAPEPVEINATVGQGLTQLGGTAEINVTLLDWQGQSGIGGVKVEAPDLFNGTVSLAYSAPGPNPNEFIYTGTITNEKLAPAGEYKYIIAMWDQATSVYLYNEFKVNVIEVSEAGNLAWAKRAGGSNYDIGYGVTALSDNSTVVTGKFGGIATFGPGETNQTILIANGSDLFVAKNNSDGTLAWVKRAEGGFNFEDPAEVTALSDNSTVVTGPFGSSATFGPGEINQTVLTSAGSGDIFIARYNPGGTLAWAKSAGGLSPDLGYGITTLSDNSTVVTGCFAGSATFGPGEPNETVLTSVGSYDIFIARYNPDGTLAWAKSAGGFGWDESWGITAISDNSTVVTGNFRSGAIFGQSEPNETALYSAGYDDIFIARYNADGTLAWAKSAGGASIDEGLGITTLSDNSTVVTGSFYDTATFGPLEPNQTVLTASGEDIFIARYNPNGTLAWAKRAGGTGSEEGIGIATLSDNSTVVTGNFLGSVSTFGQGEMNETVLTSAGSWDIFIARYNPNGTLAWAKCAGGTDIEVDYGITALSDDSTVVAGRFNNSATFGPGEPNETILTSAGADDIYIARFEP